MDKTIREIGVMAVINVEQLLSPEEGEKKNIQSNIVYDKMVNQDNSHSI